MTEKWQNNDITKWQKNGRKMTEQWQVEFRNGKKWQGQNDRTMTKKWQNSYFQDSQPVGQVLPKYRYRYTQDIRDIYVLPDFLSHYEIRPRHQQVDGRPVCRRPVDVWRPSPFFKGQRRISWWFHGDFMVISWLSATRHRPLSAPPPAAVPRSTAGRARCPAVPTRWRRRRRRCRGRRPDDRLEGADGAGFAIGKWRF